MFFNGQLCVRSFVVQAAHLSLKHLYPHHNLTMIFNSCALAHNKNNMPQIRHTIPRLQRGKWASTRNCFIIYLVAATIDP